MAVELRKQVLSRYALLLRTQRTVFAGDIRVQTAARARIREEFEKNRDLTDVVAIEKKLKDATQTAKYLKNNIMQSTFTPSGSLNLDVKPQHLSKQKTP
eukprot:TRINITY_DN6825_c0_g1_i1.p2 TRINITY_DN6825_c0_g1~~TRINITY_DN6825_c0_g1_i1.p2  ORF type:complete len:108 (-),score=12.88 TRINITY_DN6825_c0_g1_i1:80-376(-)